MPLYRYWNGKDHFYTTNKDEIGTTVEGEKGKHNYTCEGIAGYVMTEGGEPGKNIPVYRYWGNNDHFYATSSEEIGTITPGETGKYGYQSEGIAFYLEMKET